MTTPLTTTDMHRLAEKIMDHAERWHKGAIEHKHDSPLEIARNTAKHVASNLLADMAYELRSTFPLPSPESPVREDWRERCVVQPAVDGRIDVVSPTRTHYLCCVREWHFYGSVIPSACCTGSFSTEDQARRALASAPPWPGYVPPAKASDHVVAPTEMIPPLPAVSGERPDRTPKPLPVTTRTQLLGQIQQQAEAWCAVAQALDKHFPKWNPWCGRSGTENAVLCIEQAAADLARLQSELAGVKEEAVGHAKEVLRMVPVINALMDWDDTISKYDAAAMQAHVATALRDYRTALLSSRPVAGNEVES